MFFAYVGNIMKAYHVKRFRKKYIWDILRCQSGKKWAEQCIVEV